MKNQRLQDPAVIHSSPAYRLSVQLTPHRGGTTLKFISFVPTARRPEEQTKFQVTLTDQELAIFALELQKVLPNAVATATI
jgi:hypothetical protein